VSDGQTCSKFLQFVARDNAYAIGHLLVADAALVLQTVGCGAVAVEVCPGLFHLHVQLDLSLHKTTDQSILTHCSCGDIKGWT
jgi:hypothetical protein